MTIKLRPYRKDLDYSYTLGVFPTLELFAHRPERALRAVVSSRGAENAGVQRIEALCAERGIPFAVADRAVARLSGSGNCYAVGVFEKYEAPLAAEANHLVLVSPGDAGNLGTIVRTMLGLGCKDLAIVRPAADLFAPKTVRASMGAVFQLRHAHFDAFDAYRAVHQRNLYPFMTDGRETLPQVRFASPWGLIFGSEAAGLEASYHALGTSVRIPQSGRVDSLNLAVAVSIALYAAREQCDQACRSSACVAG